MNGINKGDEVVFIRDDKECHSGVLCKGSIGRVIGDDNIGLCVSWKDWSGGHNHTQKMEHINNNSVWWVFPEDVEVYGVFENE